MQGRKPLPSYPETTRAESLRPDNGARSGEPPDGLENFPGEAPPTHFGGPAERPGSTPRSASGGARAAQRPLGLSKKEDCNQTGRAESAESGWTFNGLDCPLEGRMVVDRTTGESAWSASCKNARCERCSRRYSRRTFALARTAVDGCVAHRTGEGCRVCAYWVPKRCRFITLTTSEALGEWQDWRLRLQDWRRTLARAGVAGEMLYVRENGSDTGMQHVHVVQTGPRKIPINLLDQSWPWGMTNIQSARQATDYLGKEVLRYVGKGADARETIEGHMTMNGGRAAHWTRGFFWGTGRDDFARVHPVPGLYFAEVSEPGYGFAEGQEMGSGV